MPTYYCTADGAGPQPPRDWLTETAEAQVAAIADDVAYSHHDLHDGLRSGLWFDPETGRGIAYFTTAVPDDAAKGTSAFTAAEEAVLARTGLRSPPRTMTRYLQEPPAQSP